MEKKYLEAKYPEINSNKIVNQYLGTPAGIFLNTSLSKKSFKLLSIAFMSSVKQIDKIINALEQIDDITIDWTHIGNGPLEKVLIALAEEKLSKKTNVSFHFTGLKNKSEIYTLLLEQHYNCIINTSESEGNSSITNGGFIVWHTCNSA